MQDVPPIPFSAIVSYAEFFDIRKGPEFEEFLYYMRALDKMYIDHYAKQKPVTQSPKVETQNNGKLNSNKNHHRQG
jgi:hypothetical protein